MKIKKTSLLILFICLFCGVTYFIYCKNSIKTITTSIGEKKSINKNVLKSIPKDMELQAPIYPKRAKHIMYCNLDGDKEKEVIMTFRKKDNKNIGGIMVFKREGDTWKEILNESGKNKIVYEVTFADIDGDNNDELLVGYSTGILERNKLNIYKYDKKKQILNVIGDYEYSKLDIKSIINKSNNSEQKKIALWKKIDEDIYLVNLLKYHNNNLIEAKEEYPDYFPKVVDYYRGKLRNKENKNSATMWYYFIDAQIKSNKYKEALNSIYEVKKIKPNGYENKKDMFNELEKYIVESFQ
ncbi:hypothetical protein [Clostridium botulinum]|uniref:VCBS repeat-containing protein n=1 Tax=Clostridium botulinum TaxID=1491 RepID=A0A9Q1ZB24_CLOBO|nr:hypothetical protein [Clostridium botulinum]AEB77154.1 conserved protein, putative [Clostridium botulinum BKT015925]KEH98732.1 hypothetical protein Y848_00830 [Clostridium botulinum C/D str. Sp77]KEI00609.1 hypothetical protein Z953_09505 [Clostridium botulinum D str. 16868]KLU75478.1 hypothetical protein CBC3_08240 [Clostridium botulinum V891]KOA74754.1 hypothetical protein ADU77_11855 [Clostridium botulinum]